MAHNNVFLVDEMLEKNPGMTYTQAVKALAAQEKMMEAAKAETSTAAKATPAPTADTPKGGARLLHSTGKLREDAGMSLGPALAPTMSPANPLLQKAADMALAAAPYLSPATGAAKTALGKAASILLPTGAAAHEAFKPSTAGQQAEQGIGGIANFLRESGLLKIPGLSPLLQSAAAMGGESVIGNLLNQAIERGPENISGREAAGSGLLGGLMGLVGGIYPSGMRNNAVQKMEDLTEGPLSRLATQGVIKDFTPVTETAERYVKSASALDEYKKSLEEYTKTKTKYDALQLKKKIKHESEQLAKQKAYEALPPHQKILQEPPKMQAFIPDKAPVVPKPPGPQANQIKAFYKEAGFDEADLPFIQRLAKNPDAELDKIFDDVFSSGSDEAVRTAANTTLNKVIKLFGNTKSKDVLKQKLGEHLFVTQLNPNTVRATDNPLQAFASAAKGGDSALEKLLSKEEREAMSSAVDAVQAIAKAGKLGNFRIGAGGGGIWISVGQGLLELTPSRLATHTLLKAKDSEAKKEWKTFAEYIRSLKANPLTGGRLTRATTETIEKGLLGLGAAPVDAQSVLPPTRIPGRAPLVP